MKEPHLKKERVKVIYTEEELMTRLKFFIGICLALTLMGIVFVVLYSIIFVTQPLGAISPVDSKFFELIIPIATFLTGTLSGIMLASGNKEAEMKALEAATRAPTPSAPSAPAGVPYMGTVMPSNFSSNSFGGRIEPTIDSPMNLSPAQPISRNGKFGPVQEPHPEI